MSKHLSRKRRWTNRDARTWTATIGTVAYRQDAWYARLVYQLRVTLESASELPRWVAHDRWLGPYKRPRNAMVELEREAAVLRNRHADDVRIGDEIQN